MPIMQVAKCVAHLEGCCMADPVGVCSPRPPRDQAEGLSCPEGVFFRFARLSGSRSILQGHRLATCNPRDALDSAAVEGGSVPRGEKKPDSARETAGQDAATA